MLATGRARSNLHRLTNPLGQTSNWPDPTSLPQRNRALHAQVVKFHACPPPLPTCIFMSGLNPLALCPTHGPSSHQQASISVCHVAQMNVKACVAPQQMEWTCQLLFACLSSVCACGCSFRSAGAFQPSLPCVVVWHAEHFMSFLKRAKVVRTGGAGNKVPDAHWGLLQSQPARSRRMAAEFGATRGTGR